MTMKIGKLEKVDVRELWKGEATIYQSKAFKDL